ncbi:MAG: glycosyltransferase family 2 protein [Cyanobacteria bacterium P01_C01_bin.72]
MKPEVSVIVPTYNSEKYIAKALKSVFRQSYRNLEVILIDDASTDSTVKIARSFHEPRLKIIINEQNRGVSYGRNLGIDQARGKWIALLDSDDWYATERLTRLVAVGEAQEADMVADDLFLINDGSSEPWSTLCAESPQLKLSSITLINAVKFATSDRLAPIGEERTWSLGYTKPLIKKEFLRQNQIWYDDSLQVGEDFSLYLECLRKQARFYLLKQPYYYYRTREISLSTRKPTEYLSESCVITQSFIEREINTSGASPLFQALRENLVIFQKRLAFYRLLESFKQQKLRQAISQIIAHPYLIKILWQKSLMVLNKKLRALIINKAANSSRKSNRYPNFS